MAPPAGASSPGRKWTDDEHKRYVEAMTLYPSGPWKQRAAYIGTRTPRQVMSHAQKLALKHARHARGLRKAGRPPFSGTVRKPRVKATRTTSQHRCDKSLEETDTSRMAETKDWSQVEDLLCLLDSLPSSGLLVDSRYANAAPIGQYDLTLSSPKSPGSGAFTFDL